jgi:hypothetical protein
MSFTSSSHGNTKTVELKPHILHNRMPQEMHLAGCTQPSTVMSEGAPDEPQSQLLGRRFGLGYNHIYPYLGGYGAYGAYGGLGYGYGYPYRTSCGYRGRYHGGYPWYF